MGIGAIPGAVLARFRGQRELGIHTEMFSGGVVDLVVAGAVTGRLKAVHPGHIVTTFVNGTRKVFDFVDDNPLVEFHPCDRTNDTSLIRKNDRVVAINSAIQLDLTGQFCADSFGHRSLSAKPLTVLPQTASGGLAMFSRYRSGLLLLSALS